MFQPMALFGRGRRSRARRLTGQRLFDQKRQRRLSGQRFEMLETRAMFSASPWQNPADSNDIDGNGALEVTDAIVLIQDLIHNGLRELETPATGNEPPPYVDANGDNRAGVLDAVQVITQLVIQTFRDYSRSPDTTAARAVSESSIPSLLNMAKGLADATGTNVDWNAAFGNANLWTVQLTSDQDPAEVAAELGLDSLQSTELAGVYVAELPAGDAALEVFTRLTTTETVTANPMEYYDISPRFIPNDPLFISQWHLQNTGQTANGVAGNDVNVTGVWDNFQGAGVIIGIVDNGLQRTHPDLAANYVQAVSRDVYAGDNNPSPAGGNDHGTSVAGVAAGVGNNSLGVSGVAPQAGLAGLRLFTNGVSPTDVDTATALTWSNQQISIYNNSWGPIDDGVSLDALGPLAANALAQGVASGRGNLGSIYVWAGGNGALTLDNVNYDGFANSRYTIAVGAINDSGMKSSYSEPGAPLLVSAYSSDLVGITTTDLVNTGNLSNDYTNGFGGTSSAAPVVSGVVALMLEANPLLGWRDVQQILARSARMNDPTDSDWVTNGDGLHVNHKYGFGAVDAEAAVDMALTWTNVGPETSTSSPVINVNTAVPNNNPTGIVSTFTVSQNIDIESVEVIFSATHGNRGELEVTLTSPSGTQSVLTEIHNDTNSNYVNWLLTSMRHMGESSIGTWTLRVRDLVAGGGGGTFNTWQLRINGTAITTPTSWQNPLNQFDVSNDGALTALDALLVIYELYANGPHALTTPPVPGDQPPPYLDVDGDNDVDQADAVAVINALFALPAPVPAAAPVEVAEGEPVSKSVVVDTTVGESVSAESGIDAETAAQASIRIAVEAEAAVSDSDSSPSADASADDYVAEETDQYFAATNDADDDDTVSFGGSEGEADDVDSVFAEISTAPVSDWREERELV